MKFRVLGCSGGIGGRNARTTAFLVDDDILIDGGTGVGELEYEELLRINHIFVTHAHLDHIAFRCSSTRLVTPGARLSRCMPP